MSRLHALMRHAEDGDIHAAFEQAALGHAIAPVEEHTPLSPAQMEERSLICNGPGPRVEVNAFRELRTRLLAVGDGRSFVTLVVPVNRGSGGSYVCRNLAAAFAFDETKSAVLIDCNPYHPSQHQTMHIEPYRGGLVDYLGDSAAESSDVVYETGIPRLRLIPAGNVNGSGGEYFSSPRMQLLLDTLRNRYPARYLFLDGPAVRGAPDARILADLVDLVVLVAGNGRDSAASIAQAAANFDPNKFAGVVLNQAP